MLKENKEEFRKRVIDSLELASSLSDGEMKILVGKKEYFFSSASSSGDFFCSLSLGMDLFSSKF